MQQIKTWADSRLVLSFGKPSVEEQLVAAGDIADYWDYCLDLVQQRIDSPQDDLPSDMLAMRGDDADIEIEDVNNVVFGLLLAGHETTTGLIGLLMWRFTKQPELLNELRADPSLVEVAVEEGLRFDSPVQGLFRTNTADLDMGGQEIAAGSKLQVLYASANRDPSRWENRDELSEMENPAGYLFRVGQSRSRRYIRWQQEHLRLPPESAESAMSWTEPQLPNALAALGDEERTAVILVHCFQWTYAEVGELLDLPVTTVRNRLHRGLSRLRVYLGVDTDG